jgi:hypothetical protein
MPADQDHGEESVLSGRKIRGDYIYDANAVTSTEVRSQKLAEK